jgi:hypothetical protein
MDTLVICAFSIGGLCLPVLCAALAMKKHRHATRWFSIGCAGLYIMPLLGALLTLLVLAFLPAGTEPADKQKFLRLSVSQKSLFLASGALAVLFAIGIAGLVPSIMTIVNAMK